MLTRKEKLKFVGTWVLVNSFVLSLGILANKYGAQPLQNVFGLIVVISAFSAFFSMLGSLSRSLKAESIFNMMNKMLVIPPSLDFCFDLLLMVFLSYSGQWVLLCFYIVHVIFVQLSFSIIKARAELLVGK